MKLVKKFIIALSMVFIFIFSFSFIGNAKTLIPEDYENFAEEYHNFRFKDNLSFNIINYHDGDYGDYSGYIYDALCNHNPYGVLRYVVELNVTTPYGKKMDAKITLVFKIQGEYIVAVDYYFNEFLFYHLMIAEDDGVYTWFEEYNICDYYGEYVVATVKSCYFDDDDFDCDDYYYTMYYLEEGYRFFIYMNFILMYQDTSNDEISIDYNNPIPLEDIVDTVGVKNKDGKRIGDYEIISSNYDIDNLDFGVYEVKIMAYDNDYTIYLKNIHIVVEVAENPVVIEDIYVKYTDTIDTNYILDRVDVSGVSYQSKTVTSKYFETPNICGKYEYTVSVKTSTSTFVNSKYIIVYDDIKPKVSGPISIETDSENRLTYDEIISKCVCYDEYDDEVDIELVELNSDDKLYINNYNLPGRYKFRIIATDKSGNSESYDFAVYVKGSSGNNIIDNNTKVEPSSSNIEANNTPSSISSQSTTINTKTSSSSNSTTSNQFKFTTSTKNKLSVEDLKRMLLDNDIITKNEYDKVTIKSEYFEKYTTPGTYSVIINDGVSEFTYDIEVSEIKETNNDIKSEDNNITKKDIIIYSSIGSLVLIIIILLIVILRRKKK